MMTTNLVMHRLVKYALFGLVTFLLTSFSLTASHHILILVPGCYFLVKTIREKRFQLEASTILLILFTLLATASILVNLDIVERPHKLLFKLKYFYIGILSVFAFRESLPNIIDERLFKILVKIFLVTSCVACVSGLIGIWTGFNPLRFKKVHSHSRNSGLYGMTITYAYAIALLIGMLAMALKHYKKIEHIVSRRFLLICLIFNIVGFYFSGGRGALFGLACALPFIYFPRHKKWVILYFTVMVLAVGGLAKFVGSKMMGTGDTQEGSSSYFRSMGRQSGWVRISHHQAGYYMAKENPVFGVGFRNFESQVISYKQKYNLRLADYKGHGHSNVVEVLGGMGIPGLLAYLCFIGFWLREQFRRTDIWGQLFVPFIVVYFFAGMFQASIIDGETQFFLMGAYALSKLKFAPKKAL